MYVTTNILLLILLLGISFGAGYLLGRKKQWKKKKD